jgi:hypothetical protein
MLLQGRVENVADEKCDLRLFDAYNKTTP